MRHYISIIKILPKNALTQYIYSLQYARNTFNTSILAAATTIITSSPDTAPISCRTGQGRHLRLRAQQRRYIIADARRHWRRIAARAIISTYFRPITRRAILPRRYSMKSYQRQATRLLAAIAAPLISAHISQKLASRCTMRIFYRHTTLLLITTSYTKSLLSRPPLCFHYTPMSPTWPIRFSRRRARHSSAPLPLRRPGHAFTQQRRAFHLRKQILPESFAYICATGAE